jgi:hypothetical protein
MFDLHELADIYGLPEDVVEEELLRSVSLSLTNRFGCEVEAMMNDSGGIELFGYPGSPDALRVRNIPLSKVGRSAIRKIEKDLTLSLVKRRVLRDHELLRDLAGCVLDGMVMKVVDRGSLSVKLYADGFYGYLKNALIGTCPFRRQIPRERGDHRPGEVLSFHVLKVHPIVEDGVPRIDIILSRNSKGLVEGLLMKEMHRLGKYGKVRCVKRIAGAYAEVASPAPLPLQAVRSVSGELKEYVRVVRAR